MSGDMRVLVFDEPHRFRTERRDRPDPGTGEVRLRVAYVGICGSDLHGYTGESGRRVPGMVMGHEASGWIEALGAGVTGLDVGDPVTFNPALPCDGSCGHVVENRCARLRVIGVTPDIQGAFADAIVVPADRIVELGPLSMDQGAAIEPMAIALQATRRAGVTEGDSVLVVGGGMIGQCIARTARLAGATRITLSDPIAARRELAGAGGFTGIAPEDVADLPVFDRAFDAVGISETAAASITAVKKGGTVCFVGLGRAEVQIPLFDVVVGERNIVGTFAYTDDVFREAVDHLGAGRLDLEPLIGSVEPFEAIADAFEALARDERQEVKIMMSTGASRPGVS